MTHLGSLLKIPGGRVEKAKGVRLLGRRLFEPVREPDPDPLRTLRLPSRRYDELHSEGDYLTGMAIAR